MNAIKTDIVFEMSIEQNKYTFKNNMNKKKMVWLFNHYATPSGTSIGSRHHSLAKRLNEKGWEFIIFTASTDHSSGRNLKTIRYPKLQRYDDVKYILMPCPRYNGNGIKRILNMMIYCIGSILFCVFITNRLSRPDVIIGSSVHPLAALAES